MSIYDVPEIKEHILVTLQENHLETFGDLIFTVRTNPEAISNLSGISPKVFEEILDVVNNYKFPPKQGKETVAEEQPVEEVTPVELEVPELVSTPELAETVSVDETVEEITEEEPEPVAVEVEPALVENEPEGTEEKSFEELFRLDTIQRDKATNEDDDEINQLGQSKKKKGKKRRGYTVEYDPDQDTDVVRYTHRNDEDDWKEW